MNGIVASILALNLEIALPNLIKPNSLDPAGRISWISGVDEYFRVPPCQVVDYHPGNNWREGPPNDA
jgi:hypothetical protein